MLANKTGVAQVTKAVKEKLGDGDDDEEEDQYEVGLNRLKCILNSECRRMCNPKDMEEEDGENENGNDNC